MSNYVHIDETKSSESFETLIRVQREQVYSSIESANKMIIGVGSAVLTGSIGLVNIASALGENLTGQAFIVASWIALVMSILTVLVSMRYSMSIAVMQWLKLHRLDLKEEFTESDEEQLEYLEKEQSIVMQVSGISFGIGLIAMTAFASINIL